jgi:hypothetical protein
LDTDWIPFEIAYAVDTCRLPIIAAYPDYNKITAPAALWPLWPSALKQRIDAGFARVIHVPFKQALLRDAMLKFGPDTQPPNGVWFYSVEAHRQAGINVG